MGLTKFVLKRPVTAVLCVLCLVVFGLSSVASSTLERTPEMNLPIMLVSTVYGGASPDDINELVTQPIEDAVDTLSGLDGVSSMSQENVSIVIIQYEYGTNMDEAYIDLKKKIDGIAGDLPDDVDTPNIMEININDMPVVTLSVSNKAQTNLYDYIDRKIAPEFEKISSVASVDISGGRASYVKVELNSEKLKQYGLTMSSISQAIASGDFSYPAGSTKTGNMEYSVSTGADYDDVESLRGIPINVSNGSVVQLQDVATVYEALEDQDSISRYNGKDTVSIGIKKQQSSSAVEVSNEVMKVVDKLEKADSNLNMVVVNDTKDDIMKSLNSVFETLILAVIISMAVIYLFFGDLKASLIVGTSIPISIFAALILMNLMGFSLNVVTMGALVLGVGLMVDNSIVVLESCFRSINAVPDDEYDSGYIEAANKGSILTRSYKTAAIEGTKTVFLAVFASTATICVVFLPLAFLSGLTGQMFKPLGFTIVFCMSASFISAVTIVPLCYYIYRPQEKENAPAQRSIRVMQIAYRKFMRTFLPKKKTAVIAAVLLLVISVLIASQLGMELVPEDDNGTVVVSVETRPGMSIEKVDQTLKQVEKVVVADKNVESYMVTYGGSGLSALSGGSGATLTAYLQDKVKDSSVVMKSWKPSMDTIKNCNISMKVGSASSMSDTNSDGYEVILKSTQYEDLKQASDKIVTALKARPEVTKVHSDLENAAPVVKISVDSVKAKAEGLAPVMIGQTVNNMLSGVKATTMKVNGEDTDIKVEFADGEYDTLDKVQGIVLANAAGGSVALSDVANIHYEDSPSTITREDKQYKVTIDADYTDKADKDTKAVLDKDVAGKYAKGSVALGVNSTDEMMGKEFASLGKAILTAVFLLFVVMAAQFESPRFSLMIMTAIPLALIGSFLLLYVLNVNISMVSLLGFLMLVGNVVNHGILYVDTARQYREEMPRDKALIEAGVTRMRPIVMTALTAVLAMIPLARPGEMMQGLALVNIGGVISSTILSLIMLPVFYTMIDRKKARKQDILREQDMDI
ncbi:efflux RND transporter permease subunit [Aminipila luticellarii]|uniref:Efflux RND transporter permease subunit n=1 Tax=Aminipila luticellarii TaxID=2507160 RepID=A0A410PY30_9FIRM|nr:efflux RND transporter permease subunit [Aminipila luticellarii]QAT43849.1 efflux RND transporter permease subunit [Aminipila luticellarii]